MADSTPKSYHTDPTLYLYTSLTAGSSHITTATSRLETILKANRIPFQALDVATDEKARMLWGRRAGKRKLPGLVRMGMLVGVNLPSPPPLSPYHLHLHQNHPTNPPLPKHRTFPKSKNGTNTANLKTTSPASIPPFPPLRPPTLRPKKPPPQPPPPPPPNSSLPSPRPQNNHPHPHLTRWRPQCGKPAPRPLRKRGTPRR